MKVKFLMAALCLVVLPQSLTIRAYIPNYPANSGPCEFLAFADAEKIVGQTVSLIENITSVEGDHRKMDCTYRGIAKDKKTGNGINLYFSLVQYDKDSGLKHAREVFDSSYNKINEPDLRFHSLSGIGDEAFIISNPGFFHFIMVRKDAAIIRIKLNQANENTSLEELMLFAKKWAEQPLAETGKNKI